MSDNAAIDVVPIDEASRVPALSAAAMSPQEVIARTQKVREVMDAVMKEGVHFGTIPGTDKPSLWQPGAEKLGMAFQLAPRFHVEDLSAPDGDVLRYRVFVEIVHAPTGAVVGAGVGECSTDEDKYRWRRSVCDREWDETHEDRRRHKWKGRGANAYQEKQVRTNPADLGNTVLKMGKKRAYIDGIKSTTAASDVFDQDVEDLDRAGVDVAAREEARRVTPPKAAAAPSGAPPAPAPVTASEEPPHPADTASPTSVATPSGGDSWGAVVQRVRAAWHTKGTISEGQVKRLIAIAAGNGWQVPDLKAMVAQRFGGIELDDIPFGGPYDTIVEAFQSIAPGA